MATSWKQNYFRYREYFLDIVSVYQKKQSFKVFIELVLTVITITVFSVFALKPTAVAISGLLKEIKAREDMAAQMDIKIKNIQTAQSEAQSNQAQLALLDSALPDSPDPQGFVAQMEGALATTPLSVLGLSISDAQILGTPKARSEGDYLPFSLSVAGQFDALTNFIQTIENTRRPLLTDNFSISIQNTNADEGSDGSLMFAINGQVTYLKK